jgi:hypothetical protein
MQYTIQTLYNLGINITDDVIKIKYHNSSQGHQMISPNKMTIVYYEFKLYLVINLLNHYLYFKSSIL